MVIEVWLPGRVPTPSWLTHAHWRVRHRETKVMKHKAWTLVTQALHVARVPIPLPVGTIVEWEVRRVRLLDATDNAAYCVKPYQDAIAPPVRNRPGHTMQRLDVPLPRGDGANSGYVFKPVVQTKVTMAKDEGIMLRLTPPAAVAESFQ